MGFFYEGPYSPYHLARFQSPLQCDTCLTTSPSRMSTPPLSVSHAPASRKSFSFPLCLHSPGDLVGWTWSCSSISTLLSWRHLCPYLNFEEGMSAPTLQVGGQRRWVLSQNRGQLSCLLILSPEPHLPCCGSDLLTSRDFFYCFSFCRPQGLL